MVWKRTELNEKNYISMCACASMAIKSKQTNALKIELPCIQNTP